MSAQTTRRRILKQTTGAAWGLALSKNSLLTSSPASTSSPVSQVVIARDEAITRGKIDEHRAMLVKLVDAAVQKLTKAPDGRSAWRRLFKPTERIGIKVNTLGLPTQPAVVDAVLAGLRNADIPAENIVIWDRFDVELAQAGYKLNKSATGIQCRGTDAEGYGSGYQPGIEVSGEIGSCFSRILTDQIDTLICMPVLKDHNLAGVSLGMKNFFGAIHNPNKYHQHNCDPYIVDVVSHPLIGRRWRLTICDGTRAQYHAGPTRNPEYAWSMGGVIVGTDFVATDAVATDLIEQQRKAKGLKPLITEKRPARHIQTAADRGLGMADLKRIEQMEV